MNNDGQDIHEDRILLASITRACKINYDHSTNKLPLKKNVIALLIKSLNSYYGDQLQPYLVLLDKTMLATAYYGLFRIGKITQSAYVVKACDIFVGTNKDKLMFILHSSKTHGKEDKPQTIKIEALGTSIIDKSKSQNQASGLQFCPFQLLRDYTHMQKPYKTEIEQVFVFADRTPVTAYNFRTMLSNLLKFAGLDQRAYCSHRIRAGHSSDLLYMGVCVETIRKLGRWKLNAVYMYLRP